MSRSIDQPSPGRCVEGQLYVKPHAAEGPRIVVLPADLRILRVGRRLGRPADLQPLRASAWLLAVYCPSAMP